ncbi:MAG TPA: DUF2231 domain-containing protein [Allosphingosinicella sp.]|nr:DUF2231 domain-containing protein [Allosphingosinicella sp.]
MVLKRIASLLALWVLAFTLVASPALGHRKERDQPAAAAQQSASLEAAATGNNPMAGHDMGGMMEKMDEDRTKMSTFERLLDWMGRLHPIIIHFPLAFFPAALFTAVVGRRRPAFGKPVQFLVVAGGLIAPVAMVLGWFAGSLTLTDTDPLLRVHRWLGTAIGLSGLALAIWAWKRPEEDRRPGMIAALAGITAAIIVQGWFGGALVHGIDHMNW